MSNFSFSSGSDSSPAPLKFKGGRALGTSMSRSALEKCWQAHNAARWRSHSPFIVSHVELDGDRTQARHKGAAAPPVTFRSYLGQRMAQEEARGRAFRVVGPPRFNADGELIGFSWRSRQVNMRPFKVCCIKALRAAQRAVRSRIVVTLSDGRMADLNKAHTRSQQSSLSARVARTTLGLEAFAKEGWQTAAITFTLEPAWHKRPTDAQLDEIGSRLKKLFDCMSKAGHPVQRVIGLGTHEIFLDLHVHLAAAVRTYESMELLARHSQRLFPGEYGVCIQPVRYAKGWANYIQQDAVCLDSSMDQGLCSIVGRRQFRMSLGWPSLESLRAGRPDGALAPVPPSYLFVAVPTLAELFEWVNSRVSGKYNQVTTEGSPGPRGASCPGLLAPVTPWPRGSSRPGPATLDFEHPEPRAPPGY